LPGELRDSLRTREKKPVNESRRKKRPTIQMGRPSRNGFYLAASGTG